MKDRTEDVAKVARDVAEGALFELANTPPHRPWKPEAPPKTRQLKLFSGLNCLPGQEDLFPTDGETEDD